MPASGLVNILICFSITLPLLQWPWTYSELQPVHHFLVAELIWRNKQLKRVWIKKFCETNLQISLKKCVDLRNEHLSRYADECPNLWPLSCQSLIEIVESPKRLSDKIYPQEVLRVIRLSQGAQSRGVYLNSSVWRSRRALPLEEFIQGLVTRFLGMYLQYG